ncbi:MAG: sensor histidine kinase [Heliobacteriaceae bacterium]|nr:sensor histidine kinase [Heliobacteriaceae bacterium]
MRLYEYLLDRKHSLLFYLFLMSFITVVISLDPCKRVSAENIMYVNGVALLSFLVYLLGGYCLKRRFYRQIRHSLAENPGELLYTLPTPGNYEQRLYHRLLEKFHFEQRNQLEKLYTQRKENLEFTTSWVHEIKTPLATSRLLIENSRGKCSDEVLDSLEEEVIRMDGLVEQVLYYARIDDFARDYFVQEWELKPMVKKLVKNHARIFIGKKIRIDLVKLDLVVLTDRKWLMFILNQVLSNALKYTPDGGVIRIYAEENPEGKTLVISDNGVGIKAEDIERVFTRGFTGYNGRMFGRSTGMGLYLARSLARKLGHEINIASKFGEYTTVSIHFPRLGDYFKLPN